MRVEETITDQITYVEQGNYMEVEELKQFYKKQLLKAGVDFHQAEQAVNHIEDEELQLIREIWADWTAVFSQAENEILASMHLQN